MSDSHHPRNGEKAQRLETNVARLQERITSLLKIKVAQSAKVLELRAEVERLERMICPWASISCGVLECKRRLYFHEREAVKEQIDMAEGAMRRVHEWRNEPNSTDMALALEYVAEYIEKHLPDEMG